MSEDPQNSNLEAQMSDIFNDLKKHANLGAGIDKIFDTSKNLSEIQSKITLLLKKYITEVYPPTRGKEFSTQTIIDDITKASKDILDKQFKKSPMQHPQQELDVTIDKKDDYTNMSDEAKNNFKKQLKNFAIYEVYKVMNPRRIAGETKKDNYAHNMAMGGQKLASKYEGGKAHEVSQYSQGFQRAVQRVAGQVNKSDGQGRGR